MESTTSYKIPCDKDQLKDETFLKKVVNEILHKGSLINKMYKKGFPTKIYLKGPNLKTLFNYINEKNIKLGATLTYDPIGLDEIVIKLGKKVTISDEYGPDSGNSIDGKIVPGLFSAPPNMMHSRNFHMEKNIDPEITLRFDRE